MKTSPEQEQNFIHRLVPVLGVDVTPGSATQIVNWLSSSSGKRRLLNHNLHSVYLSYTNSDFKRSFQSADVVLIDGFPLTLLMRLGGRKDKERSVPRVGSCDWIIELEDAQPSKIKKIAIIGASPASNLALQERFSRTMPKVLVRGWDGYEGLTKLIISEFEELSQFRPDLVLLGLGMPKQEIILDTYYGLLPESVYATVGGAIDQLSGFQKMPPRFLGDLGLEWLFRLVRDPRRLFFRYLVEPIFLAVLVARRGKSR
ncbi:WecB/TagA/CpsF family glycosyltransferase [Rhodococcoides fascians]|uniref:WecB/TagA/CpsF family glycosyltransferase n=1 Tax=Rhodococcoides fascians TaxID=1828 RepID=UPI0009B8C250|nr:WecB/TagA/CpsF family glycosyltransferase [Rhodococcus fascians]